MPHHRPVGDITETMFMVSTVYACATHLFTCHHHGNLCPCFLTYMEMKSDELMCEIGCGWVNHKHEQVPADLFWLSVVSLPAGKKTENTHTGPLSIAVSIATGIVMEVGVGERVAGGLSERTTECVKLKQWLSSEWSRVCTPAKKKGKNWDKKECCGCVFFIFPLVHTSMHRPCSTLPRWRDDAWLFPLIIIPPPPPSVSHYSWISQQLTNLDSLSQSRDLKIASSHL